jgi:hypothetical protein
MDMPFLARAPVLFLVFSHNVRIRALRRLWLRFWHSLLAAVLAPLILYAFKVVFRGHFDLTLVVIAPLSPTRAVATAFRANSFGTCPAFHFLPNLRQTADC